jgi:hypothetical protein
MVITSLLAPKAKEIIEATNQTEYDFVFPINVKIETAEAPFNMNKSLMPSRANFIP